MIPYYRIIWTRPDGGTVDIGKYCTAFTVKKAIQAKANIGSFSLQMTPLLQKGTDFLASVGTAKTDVNLRFQMDQNIKVYLMDEPIDTTDSSHLLASLTITDIEPRMDTESVTIEVNAMDKAAHLLAKAGAKNYPNSNAPTIIKDIIKDWSGGDVTANLDTGGGYITTTPGGSATSFLSGLDYSYFYKPIFDAIDELSQTTYTGDDRPYIFWVDENDEFHWTYPSQTVDVNIEEGTNDIYELSINKREQDEVNMVIYNAGKDKNGNSILWYKLNLETRSSKLSIAYYDWSEIVTKMQTPGYTWGALTWDSANNDEIRTQAKNLGDGMCDEVFTKLGLRWKGSIQMKGTRSIDRGNLIKITSPKFGFFGEKAKLEVRVTDIVHTVSDRGWITTLQVEEDPEILVP